MDQVTHDMVVGQLKHATEKPSELNTALVSAMIAVVDCQMATGARVKRQGVIIAGIAVLLTLCILGDAESAKRLLCFWRG